MARRRDEGGQEPVGQNPEGEAGGPEHPDPEPSETQGEEGVGPRFRRGSDDLDQLEGIEKQQRRSQKARRQLRRGEDSGQGADTEEVYPLIEETVKSQRRLKNRFDRMTRPGDALDEFS